MKSTSDSKPTTGSFLSELLAVGLEMQDRFAAEPVYVKTGKGFLKSARVDELKRIKASRKAKKSQSRTWNVLG